MKKRNVIFLALVAAILFSIEGYAVFESKPMGARAIAMGGAYTALADDVSAIAYNPAGLSLIEDIEVNTFYTQLFGLSDLKQQLFSVAVPFSRYSKAKNPGTAGILYHSFGSDLLTEKTITFAYGKNISEDFMIGFNFNTYMLSIQDFGSTSVFGLDVGFMSRVKRVRRHFGFGTFLKNFNAPQVGKEFPKDLSRELSIGVSYTPYEGATTTIDFSKEMLVNATNIKVGQEFLIGKNLALRGGIQFDPNRFTVGFGTKIKNLKFDYSFYSHAILPATHLISLSFKFPKGEKSK